MGNCVASFTIIYIFLQAMHDECMGLMCCVCCVRCQFHKPFWLLDQQVKILNVVIVNEEECW